MDEEPQTAEPVDATTSDDKSDLSDELKSAFGSGESEKPMDVEDVALVEEPSTSNDVIVIDQVETTRDPIEEAPSEDAGQTLDVEMSELPIEEPPDHSVEQVIFEKDDELDETTPSGLENDTLDFTERSINISQLDVEHHDDDSNDAFNALKQSETDALQEPKEEVSETKDHEESSVEPEPDSAVVETESELVTTETVSIEDLDGEKAEGLVDATEHQRLESEESMGESKKIADDINESLTAADETLDESPEIRTEIADLEEIDAPDSFEKPDNEEIEDIPDGRFNKLRLCHNRID